MILQPHQVRVTAEFTDLAEKISKLDDFIEGDVFEALPEVDRRMLVDQQRAMCLYLSILDQRIERFRVVQ